MSKWTAVFLSIILTTQLQAKEVELIGTIPVVISSEELNTITEQQTVYVQQMRLSATAQQVLAERFDDSDNLNSEPAMLPTRVDLGMNGTPVLDQGAHGSCVTFALTGAFDAIIGQGDYISQLCSLELGDYLYRHKHSEYSGWDGTLSTVVLKQLADYGIVTKKYQREFGCAGIKQYPSTSEKDTGKPMSINEYSANAISLTDYANWEILVDMEQAFTKNHNPVMLLRAVKKNLREGKRVTFGTLLDVDQKHVGALGTYRKAYDSWVLTPEIIAHAKNGKIKAGHQMIIIGYDDQAVINDSKGRASKGIFILRNSWGSRAGDAGNFYMSYNYFKTLSDEAQVIIPIN